jgi:Ni,Fe-hydrogenase III component G
MFGELWLSNILDSPDIKKTLADLSQLSQGTAGLASIAEKLPDQITTEREATIKQLMGEVSAMLENPDIKKTLTDLSQLSQGTAGLASIAEKLPDQIATEREATIKQLMAEVSAERKAAIADILMEVTKAMDRAESEGEELVDHTMHQATILIVISLIGYVIARLFIQYVSNKMKAPAK